MSQASALDRRLHAFRPDLADKRLEGRVKAAKFVEGSTSQIRAPIAPMRKAPDAALGLDNEALLGEQVTVFEDTGGWSWGQLERDGYVGYFPSSTLSSDIYATTHRVRAPATFIYPEPNIKRAPLAHLSLNALLTVVREDASGQFAELATGGFVVTRHIAPIGSYATDFVEIAEQMLYTPYLWGGRSRIGLDCSGLVQLALEAAGHKCPRDSDLASVAVGNAVPVPEDLERLERGDIIYWPGHCGIMIDAVMLLHANGFHMSTVIEPLSQAVRRIRRNAAENNATGAEITAVRRLPAP